MFAFLRPAMPARTNNASKDILEFEDGRSKLQFHPPSVRDTQFMFSHNVRPTTAKDGPSMFQPPYHYHMYQSERFKVHSGSVHFYIGLTDEPTQTLTATTHSKPLAAVPARRYHRFENASETEDLIMDVQLDPEDYEAEQRFFRNFMGYVDDCRKHGSAPSLFQMLVFLNSANTPLALPVGNETIGIWVSWIFTLVGATWGKWVLGYQESYPEYYESPKSK